MTKEFDIINVPVDEFFNIKEDKSIQTIEQPITEQSSNIQTKKSIEEIQAEIRAKEESRQYDDDFEIIRRNIMFVMETAKSHANEMHMIARDKEQGKEYEATNQLLRTVADSASVLLNVHERRKKYKEVKAQKPLADQTNKTEIQNAVFVGSHSELRDMLKKAKEST